MSLRRRLYHWLRALTAWLRRGSAAEQARDRAAREAWTRRMRAELIAWAEGVSEELPPRLQKSQRGKRS